jgi:Arylsulfatase A and related enzymes
MIISWPAKIKDKGGLRDQFMHVIDVVPTIYEVTGVTAPTELNGVQQAPIEGISFAYTFDDAKAKSRRITQYFEMFVNRGMYHEGWMASALSFPPWQSVRGAFDPDKQKWELYNIDEDFSQANDVAQANPEKLREMQDLWWVEAAKYNVLPLDWRGVERLDSELMGRPSLIAGRKSLVLPWHGRAAPGQCAADAQQIVDDHGVHRCARRRQRHDRHRGRPPGRLRPLFARWEADVRLQLPRRRSPYVCGKRTAAERQNEVGRQLRLRRRWTGKGGTVTMTANGNKIAEGRLERTVPVQFSLGEGLDIGMDTGSAVDFTYKLPFKFTGTIEKVEIDLGAIK